MKLKVKLTGFDGKVVHKEKEVAAKDHLQAQMKYKHIVFRDRTKYSRKRKHKNQIDE